MHRMSISTIKKVQNVHIDSYLPFLLLALLHLLFQVLHLRPKVLADLLLCLQLLSHSLLGGVQLTGLLLTPGEQIMCQGRSHSGMQTDTVDE